MANEKIKLKRVVPWVKLPAKFAYGDWIDLSAAETVKLKAGEYREIRLGVAMQLPVGYEALLVPRSSAFRTWGIILVNGMAVIDEAYCGDSDEWHFPAYATRDCTIAQGERICQFRIMRHQPYLQIDEVETLGNPDRGGLGSTGTR